MSVLLHNLLQFARLLHSLGLDVHAGRTLDVASALEHIDIGRRSEFYFALRSLLIHRQQDLGAFDEAFRTFWRMPPPGDRASDELPSEDERRAGGFRVRASRARPELSEQAEDGSDAEGRSEGAPMSYSAREALTIRDFAEFTEEEVRQAQAMMTALTWDVGTRTRRRWVPGPSRVLDFRKVVRRSLRYGGEPLVLPTRERVRKRRPLVLLCDVSGSMDRYTRMLLHFIHCLAEGLEHVRVEAFVFATRLTRISSQLGRHVALERVSQLPRQVPDWAGGTRIGDALRTFNAHWARRVMSHAPVVLLISDGWDRGDPQVLKQEMSRLRRSCHRLIWLNPLLGSPGYQPLTRGMQAALPFVDDFLPVHNLASLVALADHLNRLPAWHGRARA
jgi:hypothetical protein